MDKEDRPLSKTDNMRQWIRKTDRYEPTLNEAASQWCLHNGTELDECRPARPRDKGPAESLVNQTYRYYYSRICRDTFFIVRLKAVFDIKLFAGIVVSILYSSIKSPWQFDEFYKSLSFNSI